MKHTGLIILGALTLLFCSCEKGGHQIRVVKLGEGSHARDKSKEWWDLLSVKLSGALISSYRPELVVVDGRGQESRFTLTTVPNQVETENFRNSQDIGKLKDFGESWDLLIVCRRLQNEVSRTKGLLEDGKQGLLVVRGLPTFRGKNDSDESAWYCTKEGRLPRLGALVHAAEVCDHDPAFPLASLYKESGNQEAQQKQGAKVPVFWLFDQDDLLEEMGFDTKLDGKSDAAMESLKQLWCAAVDSMGGELRVFGDGEVKISEGTRGPIMDIETLKTSIRSDADKIRADFAGLEEKRRVQTLTSLYKPQPLHVKVPATPGDEGSERELEMVELRWRGAAELNLVLENDGRRTDILKSEVPDVDFSEDLSVTGEGNIEAVQRIEFNGGGVAKSTANQFNVHFTVGKPAFPIDYDVKWRWKGSAKEWDGEATGRTHENAVGGGHQKFVEATGKDSVTWYAVNLKTNSR